MDVFVIPVGRERYELYCEQPVEEGLAEGQPGEPSGLLSPQRNAGIAV
jgi:hypothetical protein